MVTEDLDSGVYGGRKTWVPDTKRYRGAGTHSPERLPKGRTVLRGCRKTGVGQWRRFEAGMGGEMGEELISPEFPARWGHPGSTPRTPPGWEVCTTLAPSTGVSVTSPGGLGSGGGASVPEGAQTLPVLSVLSPSPERSLPVTHSCRGPGNLPSSVARESPCVGVPVRDHEA